MSRHILIKPLITEKTEKISDKQNRYTFVVDKKANKVEIRKAVEEMFNVSVVAVNTAVMPGKAKSRYTRGGVVRGVKPSFKKAIISLAEGDIIDFYGEA